LSERPFSDLFYDGETLTLDPDSGGRRFGIDPRCLGGPPVAGAYAHVCALADPDARVPYDQPEVQQARRDALAWWIPLLGEALVCLTTISLDSVHYGGAITVSRDARQFGADPFARLFPGRTHRTDLFGAVLAPPGPVLERYGGAPWPGGAF